MGVEARSNVGSSDMQVSPSHARQRRFVRLCMTSVGAAASVLLVAAAATAGDPVVGPQVRVDTVGGTDSADETSAAASDANPDEIVAGWNDYRSSGGVRSGFSLSLDAGATWNGFIMRPPAQNQCGTEGDPMTAFDPRTGTLWAGAIAFCGNGGLYIAKKDPGAPNFETPVMADTGSGIDKGWMAAGPLRNQPDTTRVFCAYNFGIIWSDDMGQTWTNPVSLGSGIGFLPRVGPDGEIYVAYWDFGTGMRLRRSLNDGASFTSHLIATRMDVWGTQDGSRFPGRFRVPPFVAFDVDENTGDLHACYFDTTNIVGGQSNVDLYYTRSVDQGTTWETPRVINGDNDPPGDQFFSWLEVDSAGRVQILCLDSRNTDQPDNTVDGMFDAYYLVSQDGGDTFSEHRLTPDPWNSADDGILGSTQFLGDYLGVAIGGNRAYPVYIDTSNGRAELYTNVIEFEAVSNCPGDFDTDQMVGVTDLVALLAEWGACPPTCPWDLDGDGAVDFGDIVLLLGAWGPCP